MIENISKQVMDVMMFGSTREEIAQTFELESHVFMK